MDSPASTVGRLRPIHRCALCGLERTVQCQAPRTVPVALVIDSVFVRSGLRLIMCQERTFEVIWEGHLPPAGIEMGWPIPRVMVLGNLYGKGGAIGLLSTLKQTFLALPKVILLNEGERPPRPWDRLRFRIVECLSLKASSDVFVNALHRAAQGRLVVDLADEVAEDPDYGIGSTPSACEAEVLSLLAEGLRNREIAERLSRSERTVQFHVANLFAKAGAKSRTQLVALARDRGWLD